MQSVKAQFILCIQAVRSEPLLSIRGFYAPYKMQWSLLSQWTDVQVACSLYVTRKEINSTSAQRCETFFLCLPQLCMILSCWYITKLHKIIGILICISSRNFMHSSVGQERSLNCWYLNIHLQISWAWRMKYYNLKPKYW